MSLRRAAALVLRQLYLFRGSPVRILPLFAWVAIDIVLWGFITRYLNQFASSSFNFVPTVLGAVLLWDFLVRVMHGVTTAFFEDVWSRNLLNVFASPLTIPEYLAGLIVSSILTSAVGLATMMLLAGGVFGLSFFAYGVLLVPYLAILFLFGISLGVAAAAIVMRLGPSSEWLIWPIPAFLSPFAGVFYPVSTLPHWMQYVSKALPPAYVFEGMRAALLREAPSPEALPVGATLAVADLLLACWFFVGIYRHAVRTGLIARYSAESVN